MIGSFITTTHLSTQVSCLVVFWWNIKSPRWLSTPYRPNLAPCDCWLFPKLKSPLKGERFQTIDEIQENITGQLMAFGRTVWGPEVPTLKGTEVSLSCVQCFLYLVSSSISVSSFRIMWVDSFWTDIIKLKATNHQTRQTNKQKNPETQTIMILSLLKINSFK